MSKLTIQAAIAARDAAAAANTRANAALEAFKTRLANDLDLAERLISMIYGISDVVNNAEVVRPTVPERYRNQLEATANSYGFTLADHPTRKDLVVVTPLEN